MKYHSATSFFKHLRASYPDHLFPLYLIFSEDAFERKKILQKSASMLSQEPRLLSDVSVDKILYECGSPSFFEDRMIIAADFPEGVEKQEANRLSEKIASLSPAILLIAAPSRQGWQKLISFGEKEGVILELSGKKEERMLQYLEAKIKQSEKIASSQVKKMIVERANKDFALLVQECEKLFAFVGPKKEISLEDLQIISPKEYAIWEYVDRYIWTRQYSSMEKIDESLFFPLLSVIRRELRLGIQLCIEEKNKDLTSSITLWPSLLSKRKKQAISLSERYFKKGLIALFEVELLAKDGITDYDALFTFFLSRLDKYALPTA